MPEKDPRRDTLFALPPNLSRVRELIAQMPRDEEGFLIGEYAQILALETSLSNLQSGVDLIVATSGKKPTLNEAISIQYLLELAKKEYEQVVDKFPPNLTELKTAMTEYLAKVQEYWTYLFHLEKKRNKGIKL